MSSNGPEFDPVMQPDEPLTPFDITRSSERAILLKLVIGFGVLFVLAFIVIKVYQPGVRDRGDPPLIIADNTPFKIIPDDPGGFQTPDQDKEVFDVMSGEDTRTDVTVLPPPETPVDLPTQTELDRVSAQVSELPSANDAAPVPIAETPAQRPVFTPAPNMAVTSNWVVQVASLRTQSEAEATYAAVRAKHASILGSYLSDIVRVDLVEKGIYYRARVVGFTDRTDADAVCSRLKAAGQACFVTRR